MATGFSKANDIIFFFSSSMHGINGSPLPYNIHV